MGLLLFSCDLHSVSRPLALHNPVMSVDLEVIQQCQKTSFLTVTYCLLMLGEKTDVSWQIFNSLPPTLMEL